MLADCLALEVVVGAAANKVSPLSRLCDAGQAIRQAKSVSGEQNQIEQLACAPALTRYIIARK